MPAERDKPAPAETCSAAAPKMTAGCLSVRSTLAGLVRPPQLAASSRACAAILIGS
jgi:hypothetical protein